MVDTSILVDILRQNPTVLQALRELGTTSLFSTEITVMELVYGITSAEFYQDKPELKHRRLTEIYDLCSKFTMLSFDRKAALKTAEVLGDLKLRGQAIDFRDGMIAGIAHANGIHKILTHNIKHFERIPELETLPLGTP